MIQTAKVAALSVLFLCVGALAADEAIGFKSVPLGSDLATYRSAFPDHDCLTGRSCMFDRRLHCITLGATSQAMLACEQRNTWAGMTPSMVSASFKDGHLVTVRISFTPATYQRIYDASVERWGPPTRESVLREQTAGGAVLDNPVTYWERGETTLTLIKYVGRIDRSSATIQTLQAYNETLERQKGNPKAGAKDM